MAVGINEIDRMIILRKGKFWKGFAIGFIAGYSTITIGVAAYEGTVEGTSVIAIPIGLLWGAIGGLISSGTTKRFQFDDPKSSLSEIQLLTQKYAMLATPPIKSIGRDTTKANWVSEKRPLYKAKKR